MAPTQYPEYRDALRLTTYPFVPSATLDNGGGRFIAPNVFLDAALYPPGVSSRLFLASVTLDGASVRFGIADENQDEVCYGEYDISDPPESVELTDALDRPSGALICNPTGLQTVHAWGVGTHLFQQSQTEFCETCLLPQTQAGLRGFLLPDGTFVTGDVWFVGGAGVRLTVDEDTDPSAPAIRVDLVGEPLYRRAFCEAEGGYVAPRPIRKLRFIGTSFDEFEVEPDPFGDVRFRVSRHDTLRPALRIEKAGGRLRVYLVGEREERT